MVGWSCCWCCDEVGDGDGLAVVIWGFGSGDLVSGSGEVMRCCDGGTWIWVFRGCGTV
jgi:hypothetical protein